MFHLKENNIKVLFISHDASLTGAPILLLNLLELVKKEKKYDIKIVIKDSNGPLIERFSEFGKCYIWRKKTKYRFFEKVVKKAFSFFSIKSRKNLEIQNAINQSDIIFSNTITNGDFLRAFHFPKRLKIINYVHELEMATKFYTNSIDLSFVQRMSTQFLVPSKAVANHLNTNLNVSFDKIDYLNYFIPNFFHELNDEVDYLKEDFVIGIAGTLDWRKGADILSVVVANLLKKYPGLNIKFVWKGVYPDSIEFQRINLELKKLNILDKVLLESASNNMSNFYNNINLFLLLSKEDPYPLVVLEAANANKPCLCFSNSGGAPEFVGDDAGTVVPYLDVEELSQTIFSYYSDRKMLFEKGINANYKLKKMHQNEELILRQLSNVLCKSC